MNIQEGQERIRQLSALSLAIGIEMSRTEQRVQELKDQKKQYEDAGRLLTKMKQDYGQLRSKEHGLESEIDGFEKDPVLKQAMDLTRKGFRDRASLEVRSSSSLSLPTSNPSASSTKSSVSPAQVSTEYKIMSAERPAINSSDDELALRGK